MKCRMSIFVSMALLLFSVSSVSMALGPKLELAKNGKTNYVIATAAQATKVDTYVAENLAKYLKQATGANFKVVDAAKVGKGQPCIYVGTGNTKPLKDQEFIGESKGKNIYLYGKGKHGGLNAVVSFLEDKLGWRWYSFLDKPTVPKQTNMVLKPFSFKKGFSFKYRNLTSWFGPDFYYLHGRNMGITTERMMKTGKAIEKNISPYADERPFFPKVHSFDYFIPPKPGKSRLKAYKNVGYFKDHPEYFSLWTTGKRVSNKQLCLSNKELRRQFTENVMKHVETYGEDLIVAVDANDNPGVFCYCPECKKLEAKYKSPGGPLYDYLFEICGEMKKRHPDVLLKMIAYRRSQTQIPPTLPAGQKLPDNLLVEFAPIEDCTLVDWNHPAMQKSYQDLLKWSKISNHLWIFYYPMTWGWGAIMPMGTVRRTVNDMRMMKKAGVEGLFFDHATNANWIDTNFAHLHTYLIFKLWQDIDCDVEAIIKEYTDHQYGPAAPEVRHYLNELEAAHKSIKKLPRGFTFKAGSYLGKFPYLTPERIYRWQQAFDGMMAKMQPGRQKLNLEVLRSNVDFATLAEWKALSKKYPDYFKDYNVQVNRIKDVQKKRRFRSMGSALRDLVFDIQAASRAKPLPKQFRSFDPATVKRYVPRNYARATIRKGPAVVEEDDAAMGFAATVHIPQLPLQAGFYQKDRKKDNNRLRIGLDQITPGKYQLYKLGTIEVTPNCFIWFSSKSWQTHLKLGERLYEPGADNLWDAWVSLKFDGPMYKGTGKTNQVLCDQIILVQKNPDQFKTE